MGFLFGGPHGPHDTVTRSTGRKVTLSTEGLATILTCLSEVEKEMMKGANSYFTARDERAACMRVIRRIDAVRGELKRG